MNPREPQTSFDNGITSGLEWKDKTTESSEYPWYIVGTDATSTESFLPGPNGEPIHFEQLLKRLIARCEETGEETLTVILEDGYQEYTIRLA